MLKTKLLGATAAAEALAIEDVFSTYLYTGTGSSITITNGIDLAGEGGLVWVKTRSTAGNHLLFDTQRGTGRWLETNSTGAENGAVNTVTFNSTGFTGTSTISVNAATYASWTFRKAPRFFECVTWTGTGTNPRTISHNLGITPGCIIVKETNAAGSWAVWQRSLGDGYRLILNSTGAKLNTSAVDWFGTSDSTVTSTDFSVGNNLNTSGRTLVAYLFAHDPLGPSGDGSDGLIACGSFTQPASGNAAVNLGWEPQWLLCKRTDSTSAWFLVDVMRGATNSTSYSNVLYPNYSDAENVGGLVAFPTSTGFEFYSSPNATYIYIAIRRGPMREPTSGTEVFAPVLPSTTTKPLYQTSFPVDVVLDMQRLGGTHYFVDRMRGTKLLATSSTAAEASNTSYTLDYQNGAFNLTAGSTSWYVGQCFRRAPGFFDVVAYTGAGSSGRQKTHNLGVAPELLIVKSRSNVQAWSVLCTLNGGLQGRLNQASSLGPPSSAIWGDGSSYVPPTDTIFTVGTDNETNATGWTYIAYLFATLVGISKVGSYTGNGSSQTINCGFTGGARFVLIKRTDSTGDWYVWDTARGIVSGNDPHLSLNTTAAEVTSDDTIDPDSSGFIVNQVSATNVNVSSASYIYLAIA